MKTLRQIRENTKDRLAKTGTMEVLSEAREKKQYASVRDMPIILLFRRVGYRNMADKQTVALYHSRTLNKYLSIPFGPDGNLNLSEAEEINEGMIGDMIEKGRQKLHDKLKDSKTFKAAQKLGHKLPGYENAKAAKEKWAKGDKWGAAKEAGKNLAKAAATGAAAAGALGVGIKAAGALKGAVGAAAGAAAGAGAAANGGGNSTPEKGPNYKSIQMKRRAKVSTGFDSGRSLMPQKPVAENNLNVLKNMLKESKTTETLQINGKTLEVSATMAKKIMEVYDSVNKQNKKQIETMLNESVDSFKKLLHFSIKT